MGLLLMGMAAATAISYGASLQQNHGYAWADDVCSAASLLCSSPNWLAVATAGLSLVYLYRISVNS